MTLSFAYSMSGGVIVIHDLHCPFHFEKQRCLNNSEYKFCKNSRNSAVCKSYKDLIEVCMKVRCPRREQGGV